jgi:organic hydroperoxide reductase OsmC/OhrA
MGGHIRASVARIQRQRTGHATRRFAEAEIRGILARSGLWTCTEEARHLSDVIVHLRNIAGTEAAVGWVGSHTLVADRPLGKAGGRGLGFNGAELLALALGGCFCNDLRYVAHRHGIQIETVLIDVRLTLEGDPPLATSAEMSVRCTRKDGADPGDLVAEARASCMVSNFLTNGVPVSISIPT